jgi:hypothetical protein
MSIIQYYLSFYVLFFLLRQTIGYTICTNIICGIINLL